jgi:hypothetical protein
MVECHRMKVEGDTKWSRGRAAAPLLRAAANAGSGSIRPTGRWFDCESDYSGERELLRRTRGLHPVIRADSSRVSYRATKGGGWAPQWQFGGKDLYYAAPRYALMSAAISPGPVSVVNLGVPKPLGTRPRGWWGEAELKK